MEILANLLIDQGLAFSKIGLEFDYLPAGDFEDLKDRLPKAQFAQAD